MFENAEGHVILTIVVRREKTSRVPEGNVCATHAHAHKFVYARERKCATRERERERKNIYGRPRSAAPRENRIET